VTSLLSSTPRLILYIYCSALTGLFVSTPCPPTSTLFPYTTLFRSRDPVMGRDRAEEAGGDDGVRERGPARVGVAAGDLLPEQRPRLIAGELAPPVTGGHRDRDPVGVRIVGDDEIGSDAFGGGVGEVERPGLLG